MSPPRWRPVSAPARTVFGLLAKEFAMMDRKYDDSLPDLRGATTLLVGADYSGDDQEA